MGKTDTHGYLGFNELIKNQIILNNELCQMSHYEWIVLIDCKPDPNKKPRIISHYPIFYHGELFLTQDEKRDFNQIFEKTFKPNQHKALIANPHYYEVDAEFIIQPFVFKKIDGFEIAIFLLTSDGAIYDEKTIYLKNINDYQEIKFEQFLDSDSVNESRTKNEYNHFLYEAKQRLQEKFQKSFRLYSIQTEPSSNLYADKEFLCQTPCRLLIDSHINPLKIDGNGMYKT